MNTHEDIFDKVTFRKGGGKSHKGLRYKDNGRLVAGCSCPGSQNGSLTKGAAVISEGWEKANCDSR